MFRSLLAYALLAPPALACSGGTTVLDCTARGGAKSLQVCIQGDQVTYAYGPMAGPADLQLSVSVTAAENQPWAGVGRSIWEATTFRNAGYAYETWISVDRLSETNEASGGVTVMQGEKTLAQIACDPGTAKIGVWAVSDAKEARGQCWSPDRGVWGPCQN